MLEGLTEWRRAWWAYLAQCQPSEIEKKPNTAEAKDRRECGYKHEDEEDYG